MIDIYLVFDDQKDLEKLESVVDNNYYIHYLNINKHHDRSKAFKLKGEWSARKNPFVLLSKKDNVIKAYYSETGMNAVDQFILDLQK